MTKCPLLLKLRDLPKGAKPHALIRSETQEEKDAIKIDNFKDIESHIKTLSEKLVKEYNKPIVDIPLHLTIYQENSVNLTLIDLPGLTYAGSLIGAIRGMVTKYIQNPDSIILQILPSTQDLTTSEAIELSRQFDESRERTLVVVTKIDRAEKNFFKELDEIPPGLGYVCVRNRT